MRALCAAIPARSPLLPALTRSLRAASVFLTSPPQQDKRARSGTLRLYYTSKQTEGETNPETHWGTRNRPRPHKNHGPGSRFPRPLLPPPENNDGPRRTNDRGNGMDPGPVGSGLPGKCVQGAALRAAHAHIGPRLPRVEACKHRGGHPGQPPKARVAPGFPRTPFRPLPPARGRAPRATVDSHTAPARHRRKPAHCRADTSVPRRTGQRGTAPAKPKGHSQTQECPL